MLSNMMKKESTFNVNLKGLGVSLVNNEPQEILYLSIYKINFMLKNVRLYLYSTTTFFNSGLISRGRRINLMGRNQ